MPIVRELVPLLLVRDVARAVAFYTGRLGFRMTRSWEPDGCLRWCRVVRDGAAVMLEQGDADAAPRGRGVTFYFVCDDADAMHAELAARGLRPPSPGVAFYGMKQVHVTDPDGYELCFESPVAP